MNGRVLWASFAAAFELFVRWTFASWRHAVVVGIITMILIPPIRWWVLLQIQILLNAAAPLLLLAAIVIYAFRRMTGLTGGRRRH